MNQNFAKVLKEYIEGEKQADAAARMGISQSQLTKALKGEGCERITVAKIVQGISTTKRIRAHLLMAYLRDVAALAGPDADLVIIKLRPGGIA